MLEENKCAAVDYAYQHVQLFVDKPTVDLPFPAPLVESEDAVLLRNAFERFYENLPKEFR